MSDRLALTNAIEDAGIERAKAERIASVVFDANPAVTTDQVNDADASKGTDPARQDLNTIDAGPPRSRSASPRRWSGVR